MPGRRQSALLLHGMQPADRDWILARLPQAERALLDEHLQELRSLGIPADPLLAQAAGAGAADSAAAALRLADAGDMQLVLAGEPVWLVRQLLSMEDWPWRDAWLAGLPTAQRERLLSATAPALAPAAAAALLEQAAASLAVRAARDSRPAAVQAPGGAWRARVIQLFGRAA